MLIISLSSCAANVEWMLRMWSSSNISRAKCVTQTFFILSFAFDGIWNACTAHCRIVFFCAAEHHRDIHLNLSFSISMHQSHWFSFADRWCACAPWNRGTFDRNNLSPMKEWSRIQSNGHAHYLGGLQRPTKFPVFIRGMIFVFAYTFFMSCFVLLGRKENIYLK